MGAGRVGAAGCGKVGEGGRHPGPLEISHPDTPFSQCILVLLLFLTNTDQSLPNSDPT